MPASRRSALRDYLSGALWFLPAVSVAVSLVAGWLLSGVRVEEGSLLGRLVFRGSAEDARELLIVVSATMITVTGLVFTLTIVALQIASTQFSPRLLRNFLRDRGNQLVLSTFVSTFAYSLAGLHTVGAPTAGREAFVPRLAISGSLVLALASLGMLVYFIHHIAHSIQIDTIMQGVERQTLQVIDDSELPPLGEHEAEEALPEPPEGAVTVPAWRSGYVQSIDPGPLVAHAAARDLVIRILPTVGNHLVQGSPLASVWPASAGGRPPDPRDTAEALHRSVLLGHERTMVGAYLHLACDQIRPVGAREPGVVRGLLALLSALGGVVRTPPRREAVASEIRLLMADAEREIAQPSDLSWVLEAGGAALRSVGSGSSLVE